MQAVTWLGQAEFYLVFMPALYWCVDAGLGLRLAVVLLGGVELNNALKVAAHAPRPLWLDPQLNALNSETGFGLPSGHAQHAVSVWGLLAASLRRRRVWAVALAWIALIGVSRVYLAAHFPSDVLAGWAAGAVWLWICWRFAGPVAAWVSARPPGLQVGLCFLASLAALLPVVLSLAGLDGWYVPRAWVENSVMSLGVAPDPLNEREAVQAAGTLFGITAGAVGIRRAGGFRTAGSAGCRVARMALGLVGVLCLWYGPAAALAPTAAPTGYVADYLRTVLVGGWISGGAPLVFRRLRLAEASHRRA
jgi:hypothetical protein